MSINWRSEQSGVNFIVLFLILLLAGVMINFAWIGFLGSDDRNYATAAFQWLDSPPYIGETHWALRHTLVIPMAIAFKIFGLAEFNIILPALVSFFSILLASIYFLRKFFDAETSIIFALLYVTTPLFLFSGTTAFPDILELLFIVLSFWLFFGATMNFKNLYLLYFSGAAAGFAFMSRETSVVLIFFYSFLFLIGYGLPRAKYWMIALGFWTVLGAEFVFYGSVVGDIFHRVRVDLAVGAAKRPVWDFTGIDTAGNLVVHPLLDPILMVALNQEFMLLYYIAIPAGIWVCVSKRIKSELRASSIMLSILGFLWFLFVSINTGNLYLLPRYVLVTTYVALVVTAFFLGQIKRGKTRATAMAILILILGTNILGVYVDNRNQLFPERTLVNVAAEREEKIYTDPLSLQRASVLLHIEGLDGRVVASPPPDNVLFVHVPRNVVEYQRFDDDFDPNKYSPRNGWKETAKFDPGRKFSGVLIEQLNLGGLFPPEILRRLDRPEPAVSIYRVGS